MTHPTIGFIVVNYGSSSLLASTLVNTVSGIEDAEVVVVDNFSSAAELVAVGSLCADRGWRLVASSTNRGFGAGVNLGVVSLARTVSTIVLVNPDATVHDASRLRGYVDDEPWDLVAPIIRTPGGRPWPAEVDLDLRDGTMLPAGAREADVRRWLSGACLAMSRSLWDAIGGFDEDYFLYWEDVDFCVRAHEVGARLRVVADVTAVHDEGATHRQDTPQRAKSPTYYYYNCRNRLLFAAKHLDHGAQRRWLRTSARASYAILLQGGRRQLVRPGKNLLPALRGVRDGCRLLRAGASS